jgi:hypothetical protein
MGVNKAHLKPFSTTGLVRPGGLLGTFMAVTIHGRCNVPAYTRTVTPLDRLDPCLGLHNLHGHLMERRYGKTDQLATYVSKPESMPAAINPHTLLIA